MRRNIKFKIPHPGLENALHPLVTTSTNFNLVFQTRKIGIFHYGESLLLIQCRTLGASFVTRTVISWTVFSAFSVITESFTN